jgi:hypothetical protein
LFGFAAVRKNKNLTLLCEAVEKWENVPANIWKDFPSNIHSFTKGRTDYEAFCKYCKTYISISHGGVSDIKCHIMKTKHQQKVNASASSKKVSSFFVKESSSNLIATEICLAYHVVKHHQSFNSSNCNNTLFPKLFADSDVALKLSSGKTKSTKLITHVLTPHSVKIIKEELKAASYFSISTDASNHKAEKIFPPGYSVFYKKRYSNKATKIKQLKK